MSNKVKVTINSVKAVNSLNNEMMIDFNLGKNNINIICDCTSISIQEAIEDYIKSLGKSFHLDYQKSYSHYEGASEDIDSIDLDSTSRELARLDDNGKDLYNEPLREYILKITG